MLLYGAHSKVMHIHCLMTLSNHAGGRLHLGISGHNSLENPTPALERRYTPRRMSLVSAFPQFIWKTLNTQKS